MFQTSIKPKTLFLVAFLCLFIYGLGEARVPLVLSAVLAYLTLPLIRNLEKRGIRRGFSTVLVFVSVVLPFIAIIALILPALVRDVTGFLQTLPSLLLLALERLESFAGRYGVHIPYTQEDLTQFFQSGFKDYSLDLLTTGLTMLRNSFLNLPVALLALFNLVLIPVFYICISVDADKWRAHFWHVLPLEMKVPLREYSLRTNRIMSGYVRGQLLSCAVLAVLYGSALTIAGLANGWMIGMLTGFFTFIPYLGFTTGFVIACLLSLAQGGHVIYFTLVLMVLVQILESFVIVPRLVGNSVGLSTLEALLALTVAGNLFGVLGVLFAIPIGACVKELLILLLSPTTLDLNE